MHFIQVNQINKNYGHHQVLKDVSFFIDKGEFVAIMGQSGSGKSTLLNILGGMDTPDTGQIIIQNHHLEAFTDNQLTDYRRQHIGFVFQFFNLLQNITVWENIQIPLLLNNLDDNKIDTLLTEVGLKDKKHRFPHQLSGGEQQRIAMVRALIHDPAIILADEPTGSLDSESGEHILSLLKSLNKNKGKTVIMVTHDATLAAQANRIITIKDGQVCT